MNGIYIHIPFCKKVCYYCDFHFTVSFQQRDEIINAIIKEIEIRKDYLPTNNIETIYLGGGTPSVLQVNEIERILNQIHKYFAPDVGAEITLEANPDDLSETYLRDLAHLGINRLSIGVQSFFDQDLQWMNRRHNAEEAVQSIKASQNCGFHNLNVDLIYGIPGLSDARWLENLDIFISLNVPHLSAYHLSIEPKTVFGYYKRKGRLTEIGEDESLSHYQILTDVMRSNQYQHYEISNFCKESKIARHNTNYWKLGNYLGIGPSAHSFNGTSRQWNKAVNTSYIKALGKGELCYEMEILNETDRFNDYLLTGLRTMWGIDKVEIRKKFGEIYLQHLEKELAKFEGLGYLQTSSNDDKIRLTESGMFISDKIIAEIFYDETSPPASAGSRTDSLLK
jgi:oxygen-independent coproporphyrinogen-3 oxidase